MTSVLFDDGVALAGSRTLQIGLVLLTLLFTVWITRYLATRWDRRLRRGRARRAQLGERAARELLRTAGFEVVGTQCRTRFGCSVDGQAVQFDVIADYLVTQDGERWVAEVKTGQRGTSIRHPPTRRQLLEYQQAFSAKGVLLVDAERASVQRVEFAPNSSAAPALPVRQWLRLALAGAAGVALGWVLAR